MELADIFTENGYFKFPFDPYRFEEDDEQYKNTYYTLFDKGDGYLNIGVYERLIKFVRENNCGVYSDVVRLIHYEDFADNTKGNYPTIYGWR